MTRPADHAAQLAAFRAFMDLLMEKATRIVLAEPKEAPRQAA